MDDLAVSTAEYKETKREALRKTQVNKVKRAKKYKNFELVTLTEARQRQLDWSCKTEDERTTEEKEEKIWWTKMLQKANSTVGLKYPRTGINDFCCFFE